MLLERWKLKMISIIQNLLGCVVIASLLICLGFLIAGGIYLILEYIEFIRYYYGKDE